MVKLPEHNGLYYGGQWHAPLSGAYVDVTSPSTGKSLMEVAMGGSADAAAAIAAAREGFRVWRDINPLERAKVLKGAADIVRQHAEELAMLDAEDCGNPVSALIKDASSAAAKMDFFAGLVTEMKGHSIPQGAGAVNFSVREPLGVVARIIPFNHPMMFCAGRIAAPLAAGNAVIIKLPQQAPLSGLRLAELLGGLFPPGVLNILSGGGELGAELSANPGVAMVSLVGSVETGRRVMKAAADTLKPLLLELGGKNALIAFPDCDIDRVATGIVDGMNFLWCGQSCGSTSRVFLHEDIHDVVVDKVLAKVRALHPGLPTRPETRMGALIDRTHFERVLSFVEAGKAEGATLAAGGVPPEDPELRDGCFLEPTVFVDVKPHMKIAREEIFGPVLSILRWSDRDEMLRTVNDSDYGLACSIWTESLRTAHETAASVEAGYVWVNEVSRHFLGASFGGYKQSGLGREESLEELLAFTQEKNIHIRMR